MSADNPECPVCRGQPFCPMCRSGMPLDDELVAAYRLGGLAGIAGVLVWREYEGPRARRALDGERIIRLTRWCAHYEARSGPAEDTPVAHSTVPLTAAERACVAEAVRALGVLREARRA